ATVAQTGSMLHGSSPAAPSRRVAANRHSGPLAGPVNSPPLRPLLLRALLAWSPSMSAVPISATSPRRAFSFVHASDLHLELPPHGLSEIPEHLRDSLLEAPYRAADRVFALALSEKADFVVLAGEVLNASQTGP